MPQYCDKTTLMGGAKAHGLTRWLREENMMSWEEVKEFYSILQNSPIIYSPTKVG
jgi:hypothetical protein